MSSQPTSPIKNQTKLQQDRQKLKEFYKNKETTGTKLKSSEEIETVKGIIQDKIGELKENKENMDVFTKQINTLVQTFDNIDYQLETLNFREKAESLLKDLEN
ncbi:uncharacterized protein HGUI_02731 [Hanseniaspora guilliermondii]|uniref:Uncharacterized protein n=1 Tax=Hanseniaspora guilliermondii TaxID=56406 RepID=A0A1L0B653_9ASCO|nr:uncharacterized protein HGUI_02731 [Hanseniaspora guilliermondii]